MGVQQNYLNDGPVCSTGDVDVLLWRSVASDGFVGQAHPKDVISRQIDDAGVCGPVDIGLEPLGDGRGPQRLPGCVIQRRAGQITSVEGYGINGGVIVVIEHRVPLCAGWTVNLPSLCTIYVGV